MNIKVVAYTPSASQIVAAYVDIELDGWLRFNGLNLLRDGSLKSSQLTYYRNGTRSYLSAVVILDADLRELLACDILAAINTHVASLPPEERMRPPRPPAAAPPGKPKTLSAAGREVKPPEKSPTVKQPLAPPRRLLAGAKGGRP